MVYFGIEITPKPNTLKQQIYIYILISGFGVRSREWLDWRVWVRAPMRLNQDAIQGCCHLEDRLGLEGFLPRWLIYLAVVRRPQFLAMWASPLGCLCVLMTWWLTSPMVWDQKRKQGRYHSTFFHLDLEATHCQLHHNLFIRRELGVWPSTQLDEN